MGIVGILVLLSWTWLVANAKENPVVMEDYLWDHQLKKTFCGLIQEERVYLMENLEIYCAAKVKFFQHRVKKLGLARSHYQ